MLKFDFISIIFVLLQSNLGLTWIRQRVNWIVSMPGTVHQPVKLCAKQLVGENNYALAA